MALTILVILIIIAIIITERLEIVIILFICFAFFSAKRRCLSSSSCFLFLSASLRCNCLWRSISFCFLKIIPLSCSWASFMQSIWRDSPTNARYFLYSGKDFNSTSEVSTSCSFFTPKAIRHKSQYGVGSVGAVVITISQRFFAGAK